MKVNIKKPSAEFSFFFTLRSTALVFTIYFRTWAYIYYKMVKLLQEYAYNRFFILADEYKKRPFTNNKNILLLRCFYCSIRVLIGCIVG